MEFAKVSVAIIVVFMSYVLTGERQYNIPPIKRATVAELQMIFKSCGNELLEHCKIKPGSGQLRCHVWHNPTVIIVSGISCPVTYGNGRFCVLDEGGVTNIAVGSISIAANEKENRLNVFTQLAHSSIPLDVLSRSLSIDHSLPGQILVKGDQGCILLHKNIAIRVEGTNENEIANALFKAGHGKQCPQAG